MYQFCTLTGAGLQILATPDTQVVATARLPSKAHDLHDLAKQNVGRLLIVQLDMADHDSVQAAVLFNSPACFTWVQT